MANYSSKIKFDSIITNLQASSVKDVYKKLSHHASNLIGVCEKELSDYFLVQHDHEGTAIGGGVAIAHMRLPRLTHTMIIYARLHSELDFSADDKEPVDLVCLILSPDFEGVTHLQTLASYTRFFNQDVVKTQLRICEEKDDVKLVLEQFNTHKLAA